MREELERIALALQMLAPNDAQFWERRHAIICALRDLAQRGAHGGPVARVLGREVRPGLTAGKAVEEHYENIEGASMVACGAVADGGVKIRRYGSSSTSIAQIWKHCGGLAAKLRSCISKRGGGDVELMARVDGRQG